ncbi:SDR family NAD(P)-dependent oxidoreductase [Bacteroides oleiciplenus]|uniref:SDR family NAD(P)-dependent oxidoreductase n=1 Tax=Bacteroides oleiciplenus TaxID=626931 RepID=UPI0026DD18F1|nr:SDR family oxidoreductase [Bacteroides oleiciplenus]
MNNPFSLENKTVLITGASSGIGKSVSIECAKMGAKVIITGRNENRLKDTFNELEGDGHNMIVADLSNMNDIKELANECSKLDGISHNAGIAKIVPVKFVNKDDLDNILFTNATGPIFLTQMLLRSKKIKNNASVVFTSSLSGIYCVHYGESMYAASKGALSGFAKGAALELAAQGIRVNCVNPSIIQTHIFETTGVLSDEELKEKIKNYPLRRLGVPTDVSYAIIYFLSDASSWVTGNDLKIDGGYTLI